MELQKMRWKLDECPYPIKFKEKKPKIHPEIKNFSEVPENQKVILLGVREYVHSLFPDVRLFLFGSRIKGKWDEKSDYDVIVEHSEDIEKINIIRNHDFGVKVDLLFMEKCESKNYVEIKP